MTYDDFNAVIGMALLVVVAIAFCWLVIDRGIYLIKKIREKS